MSLILMCLTKSIQYALSAHFELECVFVEPPVFHKMPTPVEGLKGKDASLTCELKGSVPYEITWFKDKKQLKESRKYKFVSEGGSSTLHILGLEASDAGEYECKASNNIGTDVCQGTVKLRGW